MSLCCPLARGSRGFHLHSSLAAFFLLHFLLNLVPCTSSFLVFKVTVWTGSEELVQSLFFEYKCKGFFTPPPQQKHSTEIIGPEVTGNTSSRDTVRTFYTGFCFCREPPFLGVKRKTCCKLSVEHHSYTTQLIPDKLTDTRYMEVASWVPECHFVIAVEHTKQSCVSLPACTWYSFVN